jgi:hypothetical protein
MAPHAHPPVKTALSASVGGECFMALFTVFANSGQSAERETEGQSLLTQMDVKILQKQVLTIVVASSPGRMRESRRTQITKVWK